jgi:hypothetical protein
MEYSDDDLELGYFDSEEDVDYTFYEEEPIYQHPLNKYNNIEHMKLPIDIIQEILYHSDINTYINLCNSSNIIKNLCNNNMWQEKFDQYNIPVNENPTTFKDWVKLYKNSNHYISLYDKADKYIKWNVYPIETTNIILEKSLLESTLIMLLKKVGAINIYNSVDKKLKDKLLNIIRVYVDKNYSYIHILHYELTLNQFINFIQYLFYYKYLDENKIYYR